MYFAFKYRLGLLLFNIFLLIEKSSFLYNLYTFESIIELKKTNNILNLIRKENKLNGNKNVNIENIYKVITNITKVIQNKTKKLLKIKNFNNIKYIHNNIYYLK